MYLLDDRAVSFIVENNWDGYLVSGDNGEIYLDEVKWDKKVYQNQMDVFRVWITNNKDNILTTLNTAIFQEDWNKYAKGTVSSWEMEVLCFYYHEHELANVNKELYGFVDFNKLSEDPVVDKTFVKNDKEIKIFKLYRICGTCIAKNKTKSTVTLLTTSGVVNVKFRKEYFSLFDKQISEKGADGIKHVVEKSWFNRGNMIVVTGMRSGDDFIAKKYASTGGHQLYKVDKLNDDGTLTLKDSRYQGGEE
jgi:DNA polymerase-3 subunit alpha